VAEQPIERLRESLLGGHLGAIAHYVEGYAYPYQADVRVSADFIARCLYSDPLAPQRYRLPPFWNGLLDLQAPLLTGKVYDLWLQM
jgi:hypothetical protein